MRWPSRVVRRLRALLLRSRLERDLDEELRFHVEMESAENMRRGMPDAEARRRALATFGGVERYKDECRDARGVGPFEDLARDVRVGLRMLARRPGFAGVVILTLALGIGATTAVFGAVNGVLLAPLPFREPGQLFVLWQQDRATSARDALSPANYLDLRGRTRSFEEVAVMEPFGLDRVTAEGPEALDAWLVSENYFQLLGVAPQLGRAFLPAEHVAGAQHVVLLGDGLWRDRFGADPAIVGQTLILDGEPHTVVGVLPSQFEHLFGGEQIWAPRIVEEQDRKSRSATYLRAIGRLRPGVEPAVAEAELSAIASRLSDEYPRTNALVDFAMTPLIGEIVGGARPALLVLLGAVGCLLLIACANVANLMLSRAVSREREFAVRVALGAGRWRVVRQLTVETLLLALAGGVAGVLVARWGMEVIRTLAPPNLPRREALDVDGRVLAFAFMTSLAAAMMSVLVPALRAARLDLQEGLKTTGRSIAPGVSPRTARGALAAGQVALAVLLLVGAGLLGRSLSSLLAVERGYRTDHVLTLTVQAWQYYPRPAARAEFVRHTVERLSSLPGVRFAGTTSSLPLHSPIGAHYAGYTPEGRAGDREQEPKARAAVVSGAYFDALGVALRRGRSFGAADVASSTPVVIVNESLARRLWPGQDPIGKRLLVRFTGAPASREVVGLVADVRHEGLDAEPEPGLFLPHAQISTGAITFTIRTVGDPGAELRAAKREIWAVNPALPISSESTMEQLLDDSLREHRFHLLLLGAFATVAVLLAAIGIYGVVSYTTSERTREIGVRMALGAQIGDVLRLVLRQGTLLAAAGVLGGLAAAAALTRVLRSMLFGVGPMDALTFAVGGVAVLIIAAVATAIPARRAAKVDPLRALRVE